MSAEIYQGLVARARQAIALVSGPVAEWVPPRGTNHDVVVIGAGQSGLSIGFALKRAGISRVLIADASPPELSNWNSTARMKTLRTPKTITGLEQGIPELTFEAFYNGLHGAGRFEQLTKIPTEDWSDYVDWFRDVVDLPVQHNTRLVDVEPDGDHLRLTFERDGRRESLTTRKLVLATGMGGLGRVVVPEAIAALPRSFWSHTHDAIPFDQLKGKRIAVLGAASSAFDNAALALERGAASVDLFCRHPELAIQRRDAKLTLITELYVTTHFIDLPELERWRIISRGRARGVVPQESLDRAEALPGFILRLGQGFDNVIADGNGITVTSGGKSHRFDHIIAATGYDVDLSARPELEKAAPHIALWRDRFTPPKGEEDAVKEAYPYLGPGFEFTERNAGSAPWLRHIHAFTYAAILSHGFHVGDISSMGVCVPRLVNAIARDFFLADVPAQLAAFAPPRPNAATIERVA